MEIGRRDDIRFFSFKPFHLFSGKRFRFSTPFHYLCIMETKIDWKKVITFIIICGGLIYITESYLMSFGILLLLFVAYDYVCKKARDEEDNPNQQDNPS